MKIKRSDSNEPLTGAELGEETKWVLSQLVLRLAANRHPSAIRQMIVELRAEAERLKTRGLKK